MSIQPEMTFAQARAWMEGGPLPDEFQEMPIRIVTPMAARAILKEYQRMEDSYRSERTRVAEVKASKAKVLAELAKVKAELEECQRG